MILFEYSLNSLNKAFSLSTISINIPFYNYGFL